MNILIDDLPTSLRVGGKSYKIRTSFKDCVRVMMAFEDTMLTPQEKQIVMLLNLYEKMPQDAKEAIEQANWFLDGGKEYTVSTGGSSARLYSWNKDAQYIYAAFRQTHNVDLSTADLHWWKFLALFMDLGKDTFFCQLTSLRSRLADGTASKEEKQMARKMGDVVTVPEIDNRDVDEKEAEREFLRLVGAK